MSAPQYYVLKDPVFTFVNSVMTGSCYIFNYYPSGATTVDDLGTVYNAIGTTLNLIEYSDNSTHLRYSAIFYYGKDVNIVRLTFNVTMQYGDGCCWGTHPLTDKFIDANIYNLSLKSGYYMFVVDITITTTNVSVQ